MRIVSLLMVSAAASAMALAACGGATAGGGDGTGTGSGTTGGDTKPGASADPPATTPPTTTTNTPKEVGASCPQPTPVQVASGGGFVRGYNSAMRLQLVYQGSSIGIASVRNVDMVLAPTDGPFEAGKVSGYWYELRDASSKATYQRLFQDPTNQEAPGGPGGSPPFSNSTIDRCAAKTILVDIPNDAAATDLVVFGSPYGTSDAAVELARFIIATK